MLIGHRVIIKDLKRLADRGELSHGYVFWGPAMVGKRVVAEALANYLETGSFEEPKLLQDFLRIVPDGKNTIGIDRVREIKNFLWQKPAISARRTVVLDDAQCMTTEAQNALLKITEEPPASSLILLTTSDSDALNPTVFSRLQKIYFSPVSRDELAAWATEKFGGAKNVLEAVRKSAGRPGLLHAFLTGEDFTESVEVAERMFKLPADKRRDLVKKIMDRDDFNFGKLLDGLILVSSWEFVLPPLENSLLQSGGNESAQRMSIFQMVNYPKEKVGGFMEKKNVSFWHKLLELRYQTDYFNLNPRLQIESLFSRL